MPVKAFRLTNFMAFGEWENENDGWIELRPITLLFGRNSSGKSTILRALRFLRQSLDGGPDGAPFVYSSPDGVDVGGFLALAHRAPGKRPRYNPFTYREKYPNWDSGRKVSFDFRVVLSATDTAKLGDVLGDSARQSSSLEFKLSLSYGYLADQKRVGLMAFAMALIQPLDSEDSRVVILTAVRVPHQRFDESSPKGWKFDSDFLFPPEDTPLIVEPVDEKFGVYKDDKTFFLETDLTKTTGFLPSLAGEPEHRRLRTENSDFADNLLQALSKEIRGFLEKIEHVRPIRPEPLRIFMLDDAEQELWQNQGRAAYLRLLRKDLSGSETEALDTWLSALELGQRVRVHDLLKRVDGRPEAHLAAIASTVTIVEPSGNEIDLRDVGYGAAQVIPVIVQSLLAQEGTLTLIEQPELHLHPQAQAALGDLFIDRVHGSSDARFLIESHSEHLLLRLRRRIAETSAEALLGEDGVPPRNKGYGLYWDEFNLLFIERDPESGSSTIETVTVDHLGQLVGPSEAFREFFDDDFDEAVELAKAKSLIIAAESEYGSKG